MKLTKTKLKEMVRKIMLEDVMDKEIKNPKTGNKIKVRTALQLPGDHPANKIAKKLVAKSPTKGDEPKKKKGKSVFDKDKPAFVKTPSTGQGYSYDEPSHADDVESNWEKASKGFDSIADKYGVEINDESDWRGVENNPQGNYQVSGKNSEDEGDGFGVYSPIETGKDGETYEGNKNISERRARNNRN